MPRLNSTLTERALLTIATANSTECLSGSKAFRAEARAASPVRSPPVFKQHVEEHIDAGFHSPPKPAFAYHRVGLLPGNGPHAEAVALEGLVIGVENIYRFASAKRASMYTVEFFVIAVGQGYGEPIKDVDETRIRRVGSSVDLGCLLVLKPHVRAAPRNDVSTLILAYFSIPARAIKISTCLGPIHRAIEHMRHD